MSDRPRRQEQERASAEITEVAPGVLRAQLPIDMPGLGHVNCYILEDSRGVAIVDPGLPGRRPFTTLTERLASAGVPLRRVHTVIVTHSHPDHFGGAGRVRSETGAEIVTHERFRMIWDRTEPPDLDVEDVEAHQTVAAPAAVGSAAVGRAGPQVPVQAAHADARRQRRPALLQDAGADRCASTTAR